MRPLGGVAFLQPASAATRSSAVRRIVEIRPLRREWVRVLAWMPMSTTGSPSSRWRRPRFWLVASLIFGLMLTITFRWAADLFLMASAFADIDKVAISWRTRFIITAILLVIPLIVAIPVAVFS